MASGIVTWGRRLCLDEFTTKWRGQEAAHSATGAPHVQKLSHKPETLSLENRSLADGDSGIHMQFETHEGKEAQALKDFEGTYLSGTAVVLRLTRQANLWGTGRIIVADSAFGSVECANELLRHGLYGQMVIKTARRRFPLDALNEFGRENDLNGVRGSVKAFESPSTSEGKNLYALCWGDKKWKNVIFTAGTLIAGEPSERPRHRVIFVNRVKQTERYTKSVPRPQIIADMYSVFGRVDQHNFLRQWSLGMENHWHTHHWQTRLFSSIIGLSITNAFLVYRFLKREENAGDEEDFTEFLGHLAYRMIFNPHLPEDPAEVASVADPEARSSRSDSSHRKNLVVSGQIFFLFGTSLNLLFSEFCWRTGEIDLDTRRLCWFKTTQLSYVSCALLILLSVVQRGWYKKRHQGVLQSFETRLFCSASLYSDINAFAEVLQSLILPKPLCRQSVPARRPARRPACRLGRHWPVLLCLYFCA